MKLNHFFIIGILMLAIYGCDTRRDILEDEGVWVRVNIDWTQAGMQPNGATVWFFPQDRSDLSPTVLRTHASLDSLRLRRGVYSVLVFNDTENDHSGMHFRGTDQYDTFEAYSEYITQRGNITMLAGEPLAVIPEPLATDHIDEFVVTTHPAVSAGRPEIKLTPLSRLYTLDFSVHIKGLDNVVVSSSYATISGMSGGMFLVSHERNDERITHRFGFDSRVWDSGSYKNGKLYSSFSLFGVSGKWTRAELNSYVTLYLKLRDGSNFTVNRDVSQLIRQGSTIKLELNLDMGMGDTEQDPEIIVPDVPDPNPGSGSGFDADVEDWGDETIIEVPAK